MWPIQIANVEDLENPYYFAFKAVVDVLAQHQEKLGITEPVHFIFDNTSEKQYVLGSYESIKINSAEEFRNLMGEVPIFGDDRVDYPLQAADLYAHWVREWELERVADGVEKLKFPWVAERDIPRLDMRFEEKHFRAEFERGLKRTFPVGYFWPR